MANSISVIFPFSYFVTLSFFVLGGGGVLLLFKKTVKHYN